MILKRNIVAGVVLMATSMIDVVAMSIDQNILVELMNACDVGNAETVESLLPQYSEYINIQDCDGKTLLIHAIEGEHTEMVKFLVKNGIDVNMADIHGKPPLMYATDIGNMEISWVLIDQGASMDITHFKADINCNE